MSESARGTTRAAVIGIAAFCTGSLMTYAYLRSRMATTTGVPQSTKVSEDMSGGHLKSQSDACADTKQQQTTVVSDSIHDEFKTAGTELLSWIVEYRKKCRELPVISEVPHNYLKDMLPSAAPATAESWDAIFHDLDTHIVPGLTHWEASNRFFAYFKPHSSYPAVLGEMLCAGLNVMGFDWVASPACTELEVVTLDWLARILNLPERFLSSAKGPGGGVIQGSAGESCVVVLLAAILRKQAQQDVKRQQMVVYGSDQTHTIVLKACRILGVQYRECVTNQSDHWALQGHVVDTAIMADVEQGLCPIAVVATIGTTSSCAMDDVSAIGALCVERGLWLHIDAAYGGAYLCLPECKELLNGLEFVDSFCVNCHKKLLCPFDLAALYLADREPVVRALSVDSEYLRNDHSESGAVVDYENWQLPLGRRFRSLKLWFVLRRFGAEGIIAHVRQGVTLRRVFESLLLQDTRFEVSAPPSLSLVCFRLKGRSEADQHRLLAAVKRTGKCFIIHTRIGGKVMLRFACGGMEQTEEDVRTAWEVIADTATTEFGSVGA